MSDPAAEAGEVRERIAGALDRTAVLVRLIIVGFAVTVVLLLAVLGGLLQVTRDTNRAVDEQIDVLQKRTDELEATNAANEDVIAQAVDAIVLLQGVLRENGIEPPEITIRPTTTTEPEG